MGPLARIARLFAAAVLASVTVVPPAPAEPATGGTAPDHAAASGPDDPATPEPRYRLDPVTVTPGRLPIPLARVPVDVTIIGRARLDADRPLLLADALRQTPSVDVQRAGRPGKITDVRLRGADPRHTLVLFDGIPLSGPWLGGFDFADLGAAGVGRVEIVGGPASSLYGSGAVGGVIQVLSDDGAPAGPVADGTPGAPRWRAFAEYGGESTLRQGAEWRGRTARATTGAAATHLISSGRGRRDGYNGTTAQLHADVALRGRDLVRVSALATRGRKELPYDFVYDASDSRTHQVEDSNNEETDRLAAGRVSYTASLHPHASVETELSGLAGRIENRNGPSGGTSDYQRTSLDNARGTVALRARVATGGVAQAVLGAEYRSERVDRDDDSRYGGFGAPTRVRESVHSRALYAQAHGEVGARVFADAGLRVEDHSRHGAQGVPRIAIGISVPEAGMKLRGGFGRGFTAPTLSDLFYPGYSSSTLRPERSRTWEAGADGSWLDGRLTAHATWHTTRFQDLIQGVYDPAALVFLPENVGRARIEGEEVTVRVEPDRRGALTVWAAHLFSKNLDRGGPLPKRPEWRVGARVEVSPSRGTVLTAAWRWIDPAFDPFDFVDVTGRYLSGLTPGYAVLDLGATVPLTRLVPADLHLALTDALDRDASEVRGYASRGRSVTAGLSLRR